MRHPNKPIRLLDVLGSSSCDSMSKIRTAVALRRQLMMVHCVCVHKRLEVGTTVCVCVCASRRDCVTKLVPSEDTSKMATQASGQAVGTARGFVVHGLAEGCVEASRRHPRKPETLRSRRHSCRRKPDMASPAFSTCSSTLTDFGTVHGSACCFVQWLMK